MIRAKVMVGEEECRLEAGQIVLIPPGPKNKILNTGNEELEFLVV